MLAELLPLSMLLRKFMAKKLNEFIGRRIDGLVVNTNPFPFLYCQNFFPQDFYDKMDSIFPTYQHLTPINSKSYQTLDLPVKSRYTLSIFNRGNCYDDLKGYPFERQAIQMRLWFKEFLIPSLANKLSIQLPEVWDDDTRFVLDLPGYVKRPHTDVPQKIFSILIYMSDSACGTTLLKPKQDGFSDDYGYDHRFDQFEEVFDPPFKPNSIIAFPRTDISFHCVKMLNKGEYRRAIHINIRS